MEVRIAAAIALATLLAGCGMSPESTLPSTSSSPTESATTPTSTPPPTGPPGSYPPAWLGTRPLAAKGETVPPQDTPPELRSRAFTLPDTTPELGGDEFASRITSPAPPDVIARSTWSAACPVRARDLAWIRLTFWGFDNARHTGELLVAASEARHLVQAFRGLWDQRFPIEEMRIATKADLDAAPTGDGNNTTAFVCRPSVGSTAWSQHAYGLAVDVNPFQNPYHRITGDSDIVVPELARAFLDRDDLRPGMIISNSPAVSAFAAVGWHWGGAWRSLVDLQHFSLRDR